MGSMVLGSFITSHFLISKHFPPGANGIISPPQPGLVAPPTEGLILPVRHWRETA